ncbi:MAG: lysophospholipase [Thermoguttaceae bacterium]|nr:lysophospholipase [Thermoguttaceae bacterium]
MIVLAVVAALLTFPAAIPWMVAAWLAWFTVSLARGRHGALPLVGCCVALLIKGVDRSPGILVMGAALIAALAEVAISGLSSSVARRRLALAATALLWLAWVALAADWHRSSHTSRSPVLDRQRPVACLGDSLTAGMVRDSAYPDHLARRLTVPVLNFGREGITSEDGLERLPLLLEHRPQAVVIELGGHDFLYRRSRAAAKANLARIIEQCRQACAEVVLVEVPRGFVTDGYRGLERELAREYDLELVSDTAIRQIVLMSPYAPPGMWLAPDRRLSDDGLHPNPRGSRLLARRVAAALQRVYGDEILRISE